MEANDFALALALQTQFDNESFEKPHCSQSSEDLTRKSTLNKIGTKTLVDPEWELIDPNPNIYVLFEEFNKTYFWNALSMVEVKWSPRMTLCAGLCCYEGHGRLCSIRLSQPLLKLRPRKDLIETLLHEMIHAYLFVTANNKDRDGHGPEFCKHMYRINAAAGTNITIYHTFHDEVNEMRKHWWRCDGRCKSRPPYFGYVKRSMNRQPSKNDLWWDEHQKSCGGTFIKIKEPENYGKKTSKSGSKKSNSENASKLDPSQRKLSFPVVSKPSEGKTLGGVLVPREENARGIPQTSRLLAKFDSRIPKNRTANAGSSSSKSADNVEKLPFSENKQMSTNLAKVCQQLRRSGSCSVNENARAFKLCKVKTKFMGSGIKTVVFESDDEVTDDTPALSKSLADRISDSKFRKKQNSVKSEIDFNSVDKTLHLAVSSSSSVTVAPPGDRDARCSTRTPAKRKHQNSTSESTSFRSPLKKKANAELNISFEDEPRVLNSSREPVTTCDVNDTSEDKHRDDRNLSESFSGSKTKFLETEPYSAFNASREEGAAKKSNFNSIFSPNDVCLIDHSSSEDDEELLSSVNCPVCTLQVPFDDINTHIDICLSLKAIKESSF